MFNLSLVAGLSVELTVELNVEVMELSKSHILLHFCVFSSDLIIAHRLDSGRPLIFSAVARLSISGARHLIFICSSMLCIFQMHQVLVAYNSGCPF